MRLTMREAAREARKRNRIDKRNGYARRHRAVKTRHFSIDRWKYLSCWTVVLSS